MNLSGASPYQALLSAQIMRDYHVLQLLGTGGMGKVFLAEQRGVGNRRVALKILNRQCSENPDAARRFQNEAAAAGRIKHRNIITIYESRMTDDGQLYVAMEYVEGQTLATLLATKGALPLAEVVAITRQICAGLSAAHRQGIVHRDIKPDNLMLTEEDGQTVVKILDFGIARLAEDQNMMHPTQAGAIIGTPAYMSPEQVRGMTGDQIDRRSDTYSLGMVVYEMLTGKAAFEAQSAWEVMQQQVTAPPIPLRQRRPDLQLSETVEQILFKTLEKDPARRYQTANEFADELAVAADEECQRLSQQDISTIYDADVKEGEGAAFLRSTEREKYWRHTDSSATLQRDPRPSEAPINTTVVASRKRNWLMASALLLLVSVGLVYFVNRGLGKKPDTILPVTGQIVMPEKMTLMEYRIKRETPTAELETLGEDNVLPSGEGFGFEIKLLAAGSLYLFSEQSARKDGTWRWLNAPQTTGAPIYEAGEWFTVPEKYWIGLDRNAGVERYLMVYVPPGVDGLPITTNGGKRSEARAREVRGEDTVNIMAYLKKEAVELTAVAERLEKTISFRLSAHDLMGRVAYSEISVQHIH
ncbi:MAG: serine/threonine protein kinase [Acidobacteria bacterium]|nr:serine/threonine protein kinase [Acidobacteriota bacterium]